MTTKIEVRKPPANHPQTTMGNKVSLLKGEEDIADLRVIAIKRSLV